MELCAGLLNRCGLKAEGAHAHQVRQAYRTVQQSAICWFPEDLPCSRAAGLSHRVASARSTKNLQIQKVRDWRAKYQRFMPRATDGRLIA